MIKSIDIQQPAKMTIIKNGEVVAEVYVPGIKGVVDKDKLHIQISHSEIDMTHNVRIEV